MSSTVPLVTSSSHSDESFSLTYYEQIPSLLEALIQTDRSILSHERSEGENSPRKPLASEAASKDSSTAFTRKVPKFPRPSLLSRSHTASDLPILRSRVHTDPSEPTHLSPDQGPQLYPRTKRELGQTCLYEVTLANPTMGHVSVPVAPRNASSDRSNTSDDSPTASTSEYVGATSNKRNRHSHRRIGLFDSDHVDLGRGLPRYRFPRDGAPYPLLYSADVLENGYYTFELLRRLTPDSSPSFFDYGDRPPRRVLDLSCNEGHWASHAAAAWKAAGTRVTGVILFNVHHYNGGWVFPDSALDSGSENISWVGGHFVQRKLPFPDNSYDLVRIADIALCVPHDRWEFIFREVRRVLKPGGRLELIDDEMFFPPIEKKIPNRHVRSMSLRQSPSMIYNDEDDDDESEDDRPNQQWRLNTRLNRGPVSPEIHGVDEARTRFEAQADHLATIDVVQNLEKIFQNMLSHKVNLSLQPHIIISQALAETFGDGCCKQMHQFQLSLPPRGVLPPEQEGSRRRSRNSDGDALKTVCEESNDMKRRLKGDGDGGTMRNVHSKSVDYGVMSTKAVQVLLGDDFTEPSRPNQPYQPPGLILMSTCPVLLPFTPLELEMHAGKHIHSLLGCKDALSAYVEDHTDTNGEPLMSDSEFDGFLWDYARFMRRRFNWPEDRSEFPIRGQVVDSSPTITTKLKQAMTSSPAQPERHIPRPVDLSGFIPPTVLNGGTKVRTIRVFSAIKAFPASQSPDERTC